ncbi:MAG TPA: PDZ domain-containing protein [Acidimicrobiales bacterium]|nr:PDZ domain-containing protein [Acidimicrobiales bacterium]
MDSGGAFTFGDFPDDFDSRGLEGSEVEGTGGEAILRGWMPPEDRLWRHPSELRIGSPTVGMPRPPASQGGRSGRWAALTVGACVVAVVAGVAVAVAGPGASHRTGGPATIAASETSLVTTPGVGASGVTGTLGSIATGPDVVQMVAAMRASLVWLRAVDAAPGGPGFTGVVLPGGELVVTAASAVGSTTRLQVITADGHSHVAQVAGVDLHSGVAVLRVPGPEAAASFADHTVLAHQIAVTACLCGDSTASAGDRGADVAVGMVRQVGTAATLDGGPSLVDAIEAEMPLGSSSWGSVLLDDQGDVIGILDASRSVGDDTFGYFVPSALAVGVAEELASAHRVVHGWLGLVCSDEPGGGALVTTVLPSSAAAVAGLQPGDIVEAVGTHDVGSLADLQARLYTSTPGTRLVLTVVRQDRVVSLPVTVAAAPS